MRKDYETTAQPSKQLYVVLGMHRSGTSAITRGLQVFGIELGSKLMPSAPGNNEKGFFEDLEIYKLNIELLKANGHDWNTVSLFEPGSFSGELLTALRAQALDLLQERFRETDTYGIKDPRIPRLLPFWQPVFDQLRLNVKYIIVVRNPLSVSKSLTNRDGLPPEKSHYLWLEHLVPSLILTKGAPRVVVDYDRLLDNPLHELERIAERLGMAGALNEEKFSEYRHDFLEDGLRHTRYRTGDLEANPAVPEPVRKAMYLLDAMACDDLSTEDVLVDNAFQDIGRQLAVMSPAFSYIDSLNRMVSEREARIGVLSHEMADKDQQIINLDRAIIDRDERIGELGRAVDEHESRIANLDEELATQEKRIRDLSEEVGQLKWMLSDRQECLDFIENSLVWRLVRPISNFWQYLDHRILRRGFRFRLIANEYLKPIGLDGHRWESVGAEPFFEMQPLSDTYPRGWILLETKTLGLGSDLMLKIYWDAGVGFCNDNSLIVPVSMKGGVGEVLKLPPTIKGLRWSPMTGPGNFAQGPINIYQIGALERIVRMLVRVLPMFWKLEPTHRREVGLHGFKSLRDLQGTYRAAGVIRNGIKALKV